MAKMHYLRVTDAEYTDGETFDVGFMPLSDKKTVAVKKIFHDSNLTTTWDQWSIEDARKIYAEYRAHGYKIEHPNR